MNNTSGNTYLIGLILGLSLFIGGCDGGIFGTGDGGKDTVMMTPETGADPVDSAEMPGTSLETNEDNPGSGDFSNTVNMTGRADALLRLVNASDDPTLALVLINNNMVETPLLPLPGLSVAQGSGDYLSLETTANAVQIYSAADAADGSFNTPLAEINPLTTAAGSVTTLIARGSPDASTSTFELLARETTTFAEGNKALVRVMHTALISSQTQSIKVDLRTGDNPGSTTSLTTNLTYSALTTAYQEVSPNTYTIDASGIGDNGELIATLEGIQITAGEVITLVVRERHGSDSRYPAEIMVIRDSELE